MARLILIFNKKGIIDGLDIAILVNIILGNFQIFQ